MKKKIPTEKEIASKHGVSVEYVTRQAEIGSTVEREHVTTHDEAYGIALQHIMEFPDYYKHLLGLEKKLKKEWEKKKTFKEFREFSESAWQRKEGKNKNGGLNEKGRKSYERENPGSDLKPPQPEGGSRRDSFCARMKGMKRKLTSKKTANDPNSRINKSLRAWNC